MSVFPELDTKKIFFDSKALITRLDYAGDRHV